MFAVCLEKFKVHFENCSVHYVKINTAVTLHYGSGLGHRQKCAQNFAVSALRSLRVGRGVACCWKWRTKPCKTFTSPYYNDAVRTKSYLAKPIGFVRNCQYLPRLL